MSGWQKIRTSRPSSSSRRQAAGLPDRDLRHAAVHGRLRRRSSPSRPTSRSRRREPSVYGVVDQAGVLRLEGDVSTAMVSRIPDDVRRALEAMGQAEALDRALHAGELRLPAVRQRGGRARGARGAPAQGLLRRAEGLHDRGQLDVYTPDSVQRVGSDSRAALSDLLASASSSSASTIRRRARARQPDRADAPIRVTRTGEVTDGGQRPGRPAGGAARLHGPVPDLGADDVRLPDAGDGHREGEQGRRRAARVGQSRRDPRRQAARPRRRGSAADRGVARAS